MSNSEEWKDATVTQEGTPSLYQQGRFPSVVDTDDLVFELGKQVVDRINKEKLLDGLLKKTRALEENFLASESIKTDLANKIEEFKASNELYVQNNEKLNAEITRLRDENEILFSKHNKDKESLQLEHTSEIKNLLQEIEKLKKATKRR